MITDTTKEKIIDFLKRDKNMLSPREIKILNLRFGLKTGIPLTLVETGKLFGVTRERVRQIEAKCIAKIIQYEKNK